jgi:hypothetical protein
MVEGGLRHALAALAAGKRPSTVGSVGPGTRLDGYGKSLFHRGSSPGRSSPSELH